jgi:hypothetical protein
VWMKRRPPKIGPSSKGLYTGEHRVLETTRQFGSLVKEGLWVIHDRILFE